jgi:hypothetical protein
VVAVGRATKGVILKAQQRSLIVVGDQPYVAAVAAVTAVRTALGDVRFTAKADASCASVAGFSMQLRAVDEGTHQFILGLGFSRPRSDEHAHRV